MSIQAQIGHDDSRLSCFDRTLFRLESVMNLLGGIAIFMLVMLATVNVLGRWFFNLPIDGYIDWVEQAMAFVAFLGIAYSMRQGGHIRMDMLVTRLRGRWLWGVEFLSTTLMLCVTLVLLYGSYLHFWRAYSIGDSSLDINLPTWPAKLVVPVVFGILAVRLLLQLLAYGRLLIHHDATPIAVPVVADVASAVAEHIEQRPQKES